MANSNAPKSSGNCVYDNEPNLKNPNISSRTKSPNQLPEVRRVLGTVPGRIPQPSSKK